MCAKIRVSLTRFLYAQATQTHLRSPPGRFRKVHGPEKFLQEDGDGIYASGVSISRTDSTSNLSNNLNRTKFRLSRSDFIPSVNQENSLSF